uniref:Interleukin family protein n=1 Tax=Plecoglossus altivelis TaxID=61084 RepID=A0A289ZBZ6_PLEAT|nr:interleukin-10 [Plecoglossus altivelis]
MTPRSSLLSLLVVLFMCGHALTTRVVCSDRCCSFVEGFPVRLKELRASFSKIRDYYEANDELEKALLDDSFANSLQTPAGCHIMDNLLKFYLDTVLPTAISGTTINNDFKSPIESIGDILNQLKKELMQCRRYFSCKKPFDITEFILTYNKMENKGLYKAMGELDLFFNYIETYLASKRRKH